MKQILFGKPVVESVRESLKKVVAECASKPSLGIIYVGQNPVIENFISIKRRFGESIGVAVEVARFAEDASLLELTNAITLLAQKHTGLIVQLPLPEAFDAQSILNQIPKEYDIDVLSENAIFAFKKGELPYFPGVPGAIAGIAESHGISFENKKIIVVGEGRLVGKPVCAWLERQNLSYTVLARGDDLLLLKNADIVITGVGVAGLIRAEHLSPGVVVFDAGTTESNGAIVGDLDSSCLEIVGAYTPVPGGIGPVTVAVLFRNLCMPCLNQ